MEKASSFAVKDAQGTEYPLADKIVASSKLTGKLEQALPSGEYTVEWRIIGEDGHPIKGTFGFTVALPPDETPSPSPSESAAESAESDPVQTSEETSSRLPEASSSPSLPASPEAEVDSSEEGSASLETRSTASNLLLIAAGALVVAFVVLALRKKK
ncbi:copper resistance protein CopC [Cohnella sp.]|uniref:copper resistance CopC family protein n=1 Tax=Cohnella sp. TaxID=1883426 RepID=UPI00356240BC